MTKVADNQVILAQWQFNPGSKQIWRAADASFEFIDMPSRTRIESLVVTAPLLYGLSDKLCVARLVRDQIGGIVLQCEPPDCRWAMGAYDATGEHFVQGDVQLWDLTFRFNNLVGYNP